jgi:hypothetical protein
MSGTTPAEWEPDPITRLHALAAALPGSVVAQRLLDASFEQVWSVVSDLERSVPIYEPQVERLRIVSRDAQQLELMVDLVGGQRLHVQARLTSGWCLMQSDETVIAMAARRDGHRTPVAHLECPRAPSQVLRATRQDADRQRGKLEHEPAVIERLATRPVGSDVGG